MLQSSFPMALGCGMHGEPITPYFQCNQLTSNTILPHNRGGGNFFVRIARHLRTAISFFFRGDLGGHWVIFLLLMTVALYPMLTELHSRWYGNPLRMVASIYILAYTCTLVGSLIRHKYIRNTFYSVVILYFLLYCILEIISVQVTGIAFNKDLLAAILATNASEASEFLGIYCTPRVVAHLCGLPLLIAIAIWAGKRLRFVTHPIVLRTGVFAFLAFIAIILPHKNAFYACTPAGLAEDFPTALKTLNIKLHPTHPSVQVTSAGQPPLVMWIIGESLTSHHCSLYGYGKPTNPLLQKKVDAGEAFAYTGVQAAELHTLQAFQLMMNTSTKRTAGKVEWYNCPTLPDIAKGAGYRTLWLSNQSQKGLYDNVVSQYANLSDTCVFIGNKFAGCERKSLDGELLPIVRKMLARPSARDFLIVHLMGCHEDYTMRYPAKYDRFKENEYADRPKHQRSKLAAYDNATLYNDYIVSTLMDLVADREAVVVYAPDHGLDVYESNPDVATHANAGNPVSSKAGHDIPLVIYTTKTYRQRHPDTVERMRQSTARPFDMEDVPYLMMDLMQCDFTAAPAVARRSLIRTQ